MDLSEAIRDVQKKAEADTSRDGEAHVQLLDAVRKLNLAAETPAETLMRMRFEVSCYVIFGAGQWGLSEATS